MSRIPVLVPDAHSLGGIAVIRSLGRAGYRVYAVASNSDALGLYSRYAAVGDRHPVYKSPAFLPWLDDYLRENRIQAIVPSEGFLHAIGSHYYRYALLIPDAVPYPVWQRCMSKVVTQRCLLGGSADLRTHLPHGGIIEDTSTIPTRSDLRRVSTPLYLKADAGHARGDLNAAVRRCLDVDSFFQAARDLLLDYRALLWQGYVPGKKVGVSLWRHESEFLAENMVLGLHMQPHTGGMMSLRKSFWHDALLADAKRKLAALDWQGVAMMEYKWDPPTDQFWFIEINARYWGYLHLDLFMGKDFPALQLGGFFGRPRADLGPAQRSVSCRHTMPGEISYLFSRLRDPQVSAFSKLSSLGGFFLRFLHLTECADLWFPGDRSLYWRAWWQFFRRLIQQCLAGQTKGDR